MQAQPTSPRSEQHTSAVDTAVADDVARADAIRLRLAIRAARRRRAVPRVLARRAG